MTIRGWLGCFVVYRTLHHMLHGGSDVPITWPAAFCNSNVVTKSLRASLMNAEQPFIRLWLKVNLIGMKTDAILRHRRHKIPERIYLELGHTWTSHRPKIWITAVQWPCNIGDVGWRCLGRRILPSLGRPGLGDAARFQHWFGILKSASTQACWSLYQPSTWANRTNLVWRRF